MRRHVARGMVLGAAALAVVGATRVAPGADLSVHLTRVATDLTAPLYVTAPKGDARLFIVEQGGTIKVRHPDGTVAPFLDLTASVNSVNERGLLGMAFDPNYATNGRFYVDYIDSASTDTIVASYAVAGDPLTSDTVNLASRQGVLRVNQPPGVTNHKAGWIGFRPGDADNLYVATGDGGAGQSANGQDNGSLLGKILRINPAEGGTDPDNNYTVPADNPFTGVAGARGEIWATGLRNPYRNSFDALTGDFYVADVGEATREEVNLELAGTGGGQNYGWAEREGRGLTGDAPGTGTVGAFTEPVYDYGRSAGGSVTGGYVYRASDVPDLFGKYVFGDFGSGRLFVLDPAGLPTPIDAADDLTPLFPAGSGLDLASISSFGEDGFGRLYVVDHADGEVFAFAAAPPATVPGPMAVAFAVLLPLVAMARKRLGR